MRETESETLDKKVFVIIVTYNGARWIDKNIQSLLASSYPVNIIVADNCSTDDSVALLKNYPKVQLIETGANLGFGKANNLAMQKALEQGADCLFLLNQDAWVFEDTIAKLVDVIASNAKTGIVSPVHYVADEETLDSNFKTYLDRSTPLPGNDHLFATTFVNAAAWMLSRECVEKVGLFEPLFGHYGEDRNYCDRVLYHGFSIYIDTASRIVHDRVITRNFHKDVIQSQYKILATLINPNIMIVPAYAKALRETLGLPKYFGRFYNRAEVRQMLSTLVRYYLKFVINPGPVLAARNRARQWKSNA